MRMARSRRLKGAIAVAAALMLVGLPAAAQDDAAAVACDTGGEAYTVGSMIWNTSIPFYSNLIKGEQEQGRQVRHHRRRPQRRG